MNKIKVKLKKSPIGRPPAQREALRCLALRKTNKTKTFQDNPCVRGQLKKVLHLVSIEGLSKDQKIQKPSLKKAPSPKKSIDTKPLKTKPVQTKLAQKKRDKKKPIKKDSTQSPQMKKRSSK